MRTLTLDPTLLTRHPDTDESSYCFMAYGDVLNVTLSEIYGRPGLGLKVFKPRASHDTQDPETFAWATSPNAPSLTTCTRVQNLFARHGLAPRVYDIVLANDRLAQVTPFIPSDAPGEPRPRDLVGLVKHYNLATHKKQWDVNKRNWRGGLFIDFGGFYFQDPAAYRAGLIRQACTRRGKFIGTAYQPVPEIDIPGTRDMDHRATVMKLLEIDFTGKAVLDLGCNLGGFSRLAGRRGAKRVVGVDRIADLTYQVANWLGDWNADYLTLSLPDGIADIGRLSGLKQFDIVFGAAIVNHMNGFASWMADFCREVFIFEGHGKVPREAYEADLQAAFSRVEYLGETKDNYVRQVFRCWK